MPTTALRPALSPAVENCWTAYRETYELELSKGATDERAYERGKMAYRQAMPCLGQPHSTRDFIACVAYGMVLQLIPNEDGTKLLYAANVAAGSFRREAEESKGAKTAKQGSEAKDVESDSSAKSAAA